MKIVAWYRKWKLRSRTTYIGIREGIPIEAVTDKMGPQVIVGGDSYLIHFLSPVQESHRQAVRLGRRVLKQGFQVCDTTWTNIKTESKGAGMFRLFATFKPRVSDKL